MNVRGAKPRGRTRVTRYVLAVMVILAGGLGSVGVTPPKAHAAIGVPSGYVVKQIARHPQFWSPYMMEVASDGRLFVLEQNNGRVRIVKNDVMLTTPFHTFSVLTGTDRGLISMVLAPGFPSTPYAYFMYTTTSGSNVVNRVVRITANGDTSVANSSVTVWESEPLQDAVFHFGGGMWFGNDGMLYLATGDRLTNANGQSLNTTWSKVLRLNPDGTIPTDNPFYTQTTGANRAIYARGLRNPWQSTQQQSTGRVFLSTVGANTWEELNEVERGANYGWPTYEGSANVAGFTDPTWQYNHSTGSPTGCAITGGDFYEPAVARLPAQFHGTFLVADHCEGWVKSVDIFNGNTVRDLFTGFERPVDVRVGAQGQVYVLVRTVDGSNGAGLYRIDYVGGAPLTFTQQPQSQTVSVGASVTFSVDASGGTGTIRFQWQRNGVDITGATSSSYTRTNVTTADSGAQFRVVVSDSANSINSQAATLTVTNNQPPEPQILTPLVGASYGGGQTISYSGSATDPESGVLGASALTWSVVFHHNTHTTTSCCRPLACRAGRSPYRSTTRPPATSSTASTSRPDVQGATTTVTRDVVPRLSQVTVTTNPPNLRFTLDGTEHVGSITFTGVEGINRTLGAVTPQTSDGTTYEFGAWSDGGAVNHSISTPGTDTTYTLSYSPTGVLPTTTTLDIDDIDTVPPAGSISFVGQATSNANTTAHTVTIPASVRAGDSMLLFLATNNLSTVSTPTGVTGWTQVSSLASTSARSTVWRKVAVASDAGKVVRVPLSATTKGNLVVMAYRGTSLTNPVVAFVRVSGGAATSHATPVVTVVGAGTWAISYWVHKDSSTNTLTPPGGVVVRSNSTQTAAGRVVGLLADSGAAVT